MSDLLQNLAITCLAAASIVQSLTLRRASRELSRRITDVSRGLR